MLREKGGGGGAGAEGARQVSDKVVCSLLDSCFDCDFRNGRISAHVVRWDSLMHANRRTICRRIWINPPSSSRERSSNFSHVGL